MITDSVNCRLAGRLRFIRNDGHGADRIALNLDVAFRPVLDVKQRPLSVAALQVLRTSLPRILKPRISADLENFEKDLKAGPKKTAENALHADLTGGDRE